MHSSRHSVLKLNLGLLVFTVLGIASVGYFLSWWLIDGRLQRPWYWLGLLAALVYICFQIISHWLLFLMADYRPARRAAPTAPIIGPLNGPPTVDVFVTVCGESHVLVRKCLTAACAMRGDFRVWLLDDGRDPALKQMARELGAGYLTRGDRKDAKAGNLNHALAQTRGEIVAIFDVDHVPLPNYLEATLPYFADPEVGFVQVMLTFGEDERDWVEQAAVQSSLAFYNPTSRGMDSLDSVTMMGSNSLIRRSALQGIGNYQPGLAEDLATSLALHSNGWRSVYVAEPYAPGLAPPDLIAWFTQQFKWARGVFEVLLTNFVRAWPKLTWGKRIAYGVRTTMYWLGPAVCLHLLVTLVVIFFGNAEIVMAYERYLLHLAPLVCCNVVIHSFALQRWLHPSQRTRGMWKAVVLVFATWPIYTLAWLMAVLRVPLAFRPTPKAPSGHLSPWWLLPQMLSIVLLLIAIAYHVTQPGGHVSAVVVAAALALAVPQMLFFWQVWVVAAQRAQPKWSGLI